MTNKVRLSTFCIVLTLASSVLLVGMLCYFMAKEDSIVVYVLGSCIILWMLASLFYAPLSISVDDDSIMVRRSLATRRIAIRDIKNIRLCPPTMGERRISGSGGFCGYWGWFSQRDLGRYFAYYGKASDCFFVELRDGHNYLLGCANANATVEYVKEKMKG